MADVGKTHEEEGSGVSENKVILLTGRPPDMLVAGSCHCSSVAVCAFVV